MLTAYMEERITQKIHSGNLEMKFPQLSGNLFFFETQSNYAHGTTHKFSSIKSILLMIFTWKIATNDCEQYRTFVML